MHHSILTPKFAICFSHFRSLNILIAHDCFIWAPLFMTWVEGITELAILIKRTMIIFSTFDFACFVVPYKTGGNYNVL